jgi:PAS domain-containing protein
MPAGQPVPYAFESTWVRLDGQTVTVEAAAVLTTYYGRTGVQLTARDISARKRSEEALRQSEQQYRTLFAAQAASAEHQTRLLEETRAHAQQLELLYDAGLTLNRVLEPGAQLELLSKIAISRWHRSFATVSSVSLRP